jgi:hypothetical protein
MEQPKKNSKILISHRGNLEGPISKLENAPEYIDNALSLGYQVEIDIWSIDGVLFLGHDKPIHGITQHWLNKRAHKLWVHCKNVEAIEWFNSIGGFNYFWHQEDTVTLTSRNYIWAYPGKQPIKGSIAVMPELYKDNLTECIGICSDYIKEYNF